MKEDPSEEEVSFSSLRPIRSIIESEKQKTKGDPPKVFTSCVGYSLLTVVPWLVTVAVIGLWSDGLGSYGVILLVTVHSLVSLLAHGYMTKQSEIKHLTVLREADRAMRMNHGIVDKLLAAGSYYDPRTCDSVQRFHHIAHHSDCLFARSAKIFGSPNWVDSMTLEENIRLSLATLFSLLFQAHQRGVIDGFVYALPADKYGKDLQTFGDSLRRLLQVINDHEPSQSSFMEKSYIDKTGWQITICGQDIFLTTFAPFYQKSNARYMFTECAKKKPLECSFLKGKKEMDHASFTSHQWCYILLQPSYSFYFHDIGSDTPNTSWENPQTIRDKIRVNFKLAGRLYDIPKTTRYPMSHHIIPPHNIGDPVVQWWKEHAVKEQSWNTTAH